MQKILAIIPAYNEALNIENVVNDIKTNAKGVDYLIINDASKDNTLEVCQKNNFNYLTNIINLGLFGSVQTGFIYAYEQGYDIAIQFDGDGQHQAKYIKQLVEEINNGHNIVIGSRFKTKKKPWTSRMLGSRLLTFAIKLATGKAIKDPTSGMRAYDRETFMDYAKDRNNPPEPDTLVYMLHKKKKIKEIQVEMDERKFGTSVFNVFHSINYMVRVLISIFLIQIFRKRV